MLTILQVPCTAALSTMLEMPYFKLRSSTLLRSVFSTASVLTGLLLLLSPAVYQIQLHALPQYSPNQKHVCMKYVLKFLVVSDGLISSMLSCIFISYVSQVPVYYYLCYCYCCSLIYYIMQATLSISHGQIMSPRIMFSLLPLILLSSSLLNFSSS